MVLEIIIVGILIPIKSDILLIFGNGIVEPFFESFVLFSQLINQAVEFFDLLVFLS